MSVVLVYAAAMAISTSSLPPSVLDSYCCVSLFGLLCFSFFSACVFPFLFLSVFLAVNVNLYSFPPSLPPSLPPSFYIHIGLGYPRQAGASAKTHTNVRHKGPAKPKTTATPRRISSCCLPSSNSSFSLLNFNKSSF